MSVAKDKLVTREIEALLPAQIVQELDRYVVGQREAKRAVAIALRNRWRRLHVAESFREEITPKNILMIGPTGVGKTEISRRLAKLAKAPFVKVEATKFTEVGYVGRDVDTIIRDLVEAAHKLVKEEFSREVRAQADQLVEEKLLDLLLPGSAPQIERGEDGEQVIYVQDESGIGHEESEGIRNTREKFKALLKEKQLEEREVEVEITKHISTQMQVVGPQGMAEIEGQIKEMFSNLVPKHKERKRVPVREARELLREEIEETLINPDELVSEALRRTEEAGIVFIDEVDKICGNDGARGKGPDVSREGVQRDLLPLVEGTTVSTKYGAVRTDHVLFIASGAFHHSKPSDLMPEFQGRFPIRVELQSLTPEDFERILVEPENALTKQYCELLNTEKVKLDFVDDGIKELAKLTAEVNSRTENIGARRLHTVLEKLLEDVSFAPEKYRESPVKINGAYVKERLRGIVEDVDLARFIL